MKKMYSLKKCRHILRQTYHLFQKKKKHLSPETTSLIQSSLLSLQEEVMAKKRESADLLAKQVESLSGTHLRKSSWDQVRELVFALGFALVVAILVRQMWFEFYEIPSGSMRPTLKEQDRLAVSKTSFGINVPLMPKEFYFNPDLVKRGGIVIFTGEDMDIHDVDTLYFYLFPGKKQYVKRLIGKPGDILYFYGGEIFGIDKEGKEISSELNLTRLSQIDHIPFIDFERKIVVPPHPVGGVYSPIFLYQMNEPVAKLSATSSQRVSGEMMPLSAVHDPQAPAVQGYGELWGFRNFATARLLTKEQARSLTEQPLPQQEGTLLYLELRHNPNLAGSKLIYDEMGRLRPTIGLNTSIIPLTETHLKRILDHMYTARFSVKGGRAYRHGIDQKSALANPFLPKLPAIPDGCYEFYEGEAYEVLWQGITKKLPLSHPLYQLEASHIQLLFNVGMEWDMRFSPEQRNYRLTPARYSYFRNGDLYVMGAPIFLKTEEALTGFVEKETLRQTNLPSYRPFVDAGPPVNEEGQLDVNLIKQNGILVPNEKYLVLGDNHAMSADSREFGFVPQSNLRGSPDLIFWPPGERWGHPNQPPYPFFNFPRTVVWILAAVCITGGTIYWRRRNVLPLKF